MRYRSTRDPRAELRVRLRDLATSRVHDGYQRLLVLLRREGWMVNKKLVYRLYCEEGLGIRRRKPRRRKNVQVREARPPTGQPNESWSMDFSTGNVVKYVTRAKYKDKPLEDLKKAKWYLERLIENAENENGL